MRLLARLVVDIESNDWKAGAFSSGPKLLKYCIAFEGGAVFESYWRPFLMCVDQMFNLRLFSLNIVAVGICDWRLLERLDGIDRNSDGLIN